MLELTDKIKPTNWSYSVFEAGVLVVIRLLFLMAFDYTGYLRLPQNSQAPTRPFTVQVGRFNTSLSNLGDLARLNVTLRDVPFLLRSQGSLPTHYGVAPLRGGRNFLRHRPGSRPPAHQPQIINDI